MDYFPFIFISVGDAPIHFVVRNKNKNIIRLFMQYDPDLSVRSTTDGTPLHIQTSDDIKCILNGLDNEQPSSAVVKKKKKAVLSTFPPSVSSNSSPMITTQRGIEQQISQVQQHYLLKYITQAHENGTPSYLPIFCKSCGQPFTYPMGAISITCPTCMSQNEIN